MHDLKLPLLTIRVTLNCALNAHFFLLLVFLVHVAVIGRLKAVFRVHPLRSWVDTEARGTAFPRQKRKGNAVTPQFDH